MWKFSNLYPPFELPQVSHNTIDTYVVVTVGGQGGGGSKEKKRKKTTEWEINKHCRVNTLVAEKKKKKLQNMLVCCEKIKKEYCFCKKWRK